MSSKGRKQPGAIAWLDLTVPDAVPIKDFYAAVVGWEPQPLDMGGYTDFVMAAPQSGQPAGGVCFARGSNADMPPLWLAYVVVEDVIASIARCRQHGGAVVTGPKGSEGSRYCVIRDPAGAVIALAEPEFGADVAS
ncbi:VOC family protein [Streptomyces sp. NPDC042319]|uniref:VOC family protein n=1 Tax=Streptomyces sp. NPDC042319 TaxID=3154332 RepID=UPI00340F4CD2